MTEVPATTLFRDLLPRAKQQPADQQQQPAVSHGADDAAATGPSSPTGGGGRNRQWRDDNDRKLHSDQEMFSCTALTGRMGRDYYIKSDGCMDYGFNRCQGEAWTGLSN